MFLLCYSKTRYGSLCSGRANFCKFGLRSSSMTGCRSWNIPVSHHPLPEAGGRKASDSLSTSVRAVRHCPQSSALWRCVLGVFIRQHTECYFWQLWGKMGSLQRQHPCPHEAWSSEAKDESSSENHRNESTILSWKRNTQKWTLVSMRWCTKRTWHHHRAGFPRKPGDDLLVSMSGDQPGEEGVEWKVQRTQCRGDSMCKEPVMVSTEDAQDDWNRGQMMPSQQHALGDRTSVCHRSP